MLRISIFKRRTRAKKIILGWRVLASIAILAYLVSRPEVKSVGEELFAAAQTAVNEGEREAGRQAPIQGVKPVTEAPAK